MLRAPLRKFQSLHYIILSGETSQEFFSLSLTRSYITVFYVHGSIHRESVSITVQQDATIRGFIIFSADNSTCFGCYPHPSSGAHSNVITSSGTGRSVFATVRKYGSTSARCCIYSLNVFVLMDEGVIRNMYSCLLKIY